MLYSVFTLTLAWYLTLALDMLFLTPNIWHLIFDTGTWYVYTWHLISDTWYLTPALDMYILDTWYMTYDIWHWYVICYTWHLIHDTWYLTPVLDMLYLTHDLWYLISDTGTWHVILDTWYCNTWLDTMTPDTCTALHIHDYHFYRDLAWLLYCYQIFGTPELLYTWTPETGRLLTLCS